MNPLDELKIALTRRQFFGRTATGIGATALASLLDESASGSPATAVAGLGPKPHFPPRAKRIIYLFMHGGPSQMDLFDYKPGLAARHGEDLPASVRMNQRLTTMSSRQTTLPVAPSPFKFAQHGRSGAWMSELLPKLGTVADDLCIVRSVETEAINHDPAVTFLQTGHQQPGRPSFGAWLSYGLGSENRDLPAFVVLTSRGSAISPADPLYARLWGAGFLPSNHQGVSFRSSGDPVLYLSNPEGVADDDRRRVLDTLAELNGKQHAATLDPEIDTRIKQYEMAYRMQSSVPELTDTRGETAETFDLYGPDARTPGTFAANCLLARRLAERGVRFIQLYHRGWDQHYNLPSNVRLQAGDVDQPCAALITDLKRRGLLDDTLVVWGGEFGRTTYSQGKLTATNFGRDHHPRCFTMWMAGGGIRPGTTYGETDDYCYNVVRDGVHVHDLNATLLRCLGIDHTRLVFKFQGRRYRLTDVHGKVVERILV
ncbi:MAG TPA: DUF1501 domain-containing protein [Pirellulales bacterium]|jgi:uncharacterized protein (DUF1501 family)|nr:DUF1501 domain-containing protein [Pirellulales bacterium]